MPDVINEITVNYEDCEYIFRVLNDKIELPYKSPSITFMEDILKTYKKKI